MSSEEIRTPAEQAEYDRPRTITMDLSLDDVLFFRSMACPAKGDPLADVLGYLTLWGVGSYSRLTLYRARDEMVAFYQNYEGTRKFVMGVIWRPELGRFTTHS